MKLKTLILVVLLCLLLSLVGMTASAQTGRTSRLTIDVWDHASQIVTLYFGNDDSASYYIDDGTFNTIQTINIGEAEGPPSPPTGEDVRWKTTPGHPATAWGVGLVPKDYRAFPTNATRKDTFKVYFTNSDIPDSDFTFTWDQVGYAARCDSIFFVYNDPNQGITFKINMLAQASVSVTAPGTNTITQAFIYKYWNNTRPDEARIENPKIPASFGLGQNFPNPFNPSTTIKFDIQKNSVADISIYNILGQRIATLVTDRLSPGTYSTVWNGTTDNGAAVSSGVYFVRLSARVEGSNEPYVALRKLLLMK